MVSKSKIFIVVGTPGSGKDILIQAVNDMGSLHAQIVPKHTTRVRHPEKDGTEMICSDDENYDLENCDIKYDNYTDTYGIKSKEVWENVTKEILQVIVVSNVTAINDIKKKFGPLVKILFVHSEINKKKYKKEQIAAGIPIDYIENRINKYDKAINMFLANYNLFDHVLIYSGSEEDLYDQIFRLFNHYETKQI